MKSKSFCKIIFLLHLLLFLALTAAGNKNPGCDYELLICGGSVFDGSLNPPFKADVAVKDGKIVKIAKNINKTKAKKIINARGLHVSPGFIDLHTHAERGMYYPENRACLNYLKQGVTTIVVGQCGSSGWPLFETFADQEKRWSESGIGPNAAMLVGHGAVRQFVMGNDARKPTTAELAKMKALVKEAMEQGASGLSTGLIYKPGMFATTGEIIELVKIIAPYGGIYHSHIRNEADHILAAMKEAIEIGEKTGAPVHISHIKSVGIKNWGRLNQACEIIENAQKRGIKISADQYPFRFANTIPYRRPVPTKTWLGDARDLLLQREDIKKLLEPMKETQLKDLHIKMSAAAIISPRFREYLDQLPKEELVDRLGRALLNTGDFHSPENDKERVLFLKRWHDPAEKEKIRQEVKRSLYSRTNPENTMIAVCVEKNLEGKSLLEAAKIKGKTVEDTAVELHLMGTLVIPFLMSEEDIEYAMKKDYVATGSDGVAPPFGISLYHKRAYTTFLHKIKKYGLERKTVSLSHIIRSQTSLAARIMNWHDRGRIKQGYHADIVVFDMNNIKTDSSISNPHCYSSGVVYLLVNGETVIDKGKWNGSLPGKVIKLKK